MRHGVCLTPIFPAAINNSSLMIRLIGEIREKKIFDCVEMYFEGSETEESAIRKALSEAGLEAVFLGGLPVKRDGVDISSAVEDIRTAGVEACKKYIEHALRMGCSKVVIASGPDRKTEGCREEVVRQMRKSLSELDSFCRGTQMEITLEPFPVKTEPYLAVGGAELVRDIFGDPDVRFEHVGITFDTSHFAQLRENIEDSFRILRPWIHHVHLANCVIDDKESPLYGDKHPLFSQEGGSFSLETIRDFYRKTEADGGLKNVDICSLEIISRGKEDWYYDEICEEAEGIWK